MPLPQWRVLWLNLIVEGFYDTYSLHKHFTIHSFKSRILLKLEFKPQYQPISSKITCISFERKFGNCFVSDCSTAATRWQRLSFWWPQGCSKSRCDGKLRQQGGGWPSPSKLCRGEVEDQRAERRFPLCSSDTDHAAPTVLYWSCHCWCPGHEAGNFSGVVWIDTQSHHVRRQHINLRRP